MLLHLPIVILTTLSPVAVADTAPTFDIVRECRFEGGSAANVDQCARDEVQALRQLEAEWTRFAGADKSSCTAETTIGGFASYVELLTCLEMAGDFVAANHDPDPRVRSETRPTQPGWPSVTVGEGH
jgi:hypothetical protein